MNRKPLLAPRPTMAFRRGPAGDHVQPRTRDKWERQADEAAHRILRGERNVARILTAAPAASYRVAASIGEPLPISMRQELEAGFGADLTAIRIHRDAAAASAARDEQARAFASGRDIYFDSGRFDSTDGRRLLLHEVAHVLQQTGRASSDGTPRATVQSSCGEIQRDPDYPSFPELRRLHGRLRKGQPESRAYSSVADALAQRTNANSPGAALADYLKSALPMIKSWPAEAESLLYDTLKRASLFNLAAQLIARDDFAGGARIQTVLESSELEAALERQNDGGAVYVKALEKHPTIKFYADELTRLVEVFVFQPADAQVPEMRRRSGAVTKTAVEGPTINEQALELQKNLEDATDLSANEWFFYALVVLDRLNTLRSDRCVEIQKAAQTAAGKTKESALARQRRHAEGIVTWGSHLADSPKDIFADLPREKTSGWTPYLKRLGASVAAIGTHALELWTRADSIDQAMRIWLGATATTDEQAAAKRLLIGVGQAARSFGLPEVLIHTLEELTRPGAAKESPPAAAEFRQRAQALQQQLEDFSLSRLETPLARQLHTGKSDDIVAALWIVAWLRGVIRNVAWMAGGTAAKPNAALLDDRVLTRIRLAKKIANFAEPLRLTDVARAADVILHATLEKNSQLAIVPFRDGKYWHPDPAAPISALGTLGSIKGWEPLTGRHLALLFQADYYDAMTAAITDQLPDTAGDSSERSLAAGTRKAFSVLAEANQTVRAHARPEKWQVADSEVAFKEKREGLLAELIQLHPSFAEIVEHANQARAESILPSGGSTPYVWFIPFDQLTSVLHGIDILNAQVALTLPGDAAAAKKIAQAKALPDDDWFRLFVGQMQKRLGDHRLGPQDIAALEKALLGELQTAQTTAWNTLREALKKNARLDRQLVAREVSAHLAKFHGNHNLANEPMAAFDVIAKFFVSVRTLDDEDIIAEMTALFLDIAPALDAALGHENRFEIIHAYLGLMLQSVAFLPAFQAMDEKTRHAFLPAYQNSDSWIEPRAKALKDITDHFSRIREQLQMRSGYRASAASSSFKVFMAGSSAIPAGIPLYPREGQSILGEAKYQHYRVLKILRDYVFHPAYGYQGETGGNKANEKTASTGFSPARVLETDDKTPLGKDEPLLAVQVLDPKNVQIGELLTVSPADQEVLEDIHNGLAWAAFGSEMENINAAIAWYVNTALDLAEFIPGVGQGVTATRIAVTITDFFTSPAGFDAIKELLNGGLINTVKELKDKIASAADPENLIKLLLFGDPLLDKLLAHTGNDSQTPASAGTDDEAGRLGKIIQAFKRLGHAVAKAIRYLNVVVERPMEDIRSLVTSRPLLSSGVQYIADHIYTIQDKGASIIAFLRQDSEDASGAEGVSHSFQAEQTEFAEHIQDILQQFAELKLPNSVIDITPVIAAVLDKIEVYIGEKGLGRKGRIVFTVLRESGALAYVNRRISDQIVKKGLDPNIIWRKEIVPEIADKFTAGRDAAIDAINSVLTAPVFDGLIKPISKLEPITLQTGGEPFAETQENYQEPTPDPAADAHGAPSPDRPLDARPPVLDLSEPGAPLNAGLRQRSETAFGQDLRHVRLHAGVEARRMTEAFGVDGLATGSHIFLRPGLSPGIGRGGDVFRHEIAHVLQQTGTRPLDGSVSSLPVKGRPELGLDLDPLHERAADRLAAQTREGQRPSLATADIGQPLGLQPAGLKLSTLARVMESFRDLGAVEASAKRFGAGRSVAGGLPAGVRAIVDQIIDMLTLESRFSKALQKPLGVFESVTESIRTQLHGERDVIRKAAYEIASEDLKDSKKKPAAKGASPEKELKGRHFVRLLEEVILARSGIVLGLTLKRSKGVIDASAPLESIRILFVYLGEIPHQQGLWQKAIDAWEGSKDATQRDKILKHASRLVREWGVDLRVWPRRGQYRFSNAFLKEANERIAHDIKGEDLAPGQLTPTQDYVKPSGTSPIGLRFGTYDIGPGAGRNLHHITQYVLPEYFANSNPTAQPFDPGRQYPGVTWNSDRKTVKTISPSPDSTGADGIRVWDTRADSGRGPKMPTISLAASTHRNANLHLTRDPDDPPGATHSQHADWVHERYTSKIPAALRPGAPRHPPFAGTPAQAAKAIYLAVQSTYNEVADRMGEKLASRMPQAEFHYYAEQAHDTEYLRDKDNKSQKTKREAQFEANLNKVPDEASRYSAKVLADFGWLRST